MKKKISKRKNRCRGHLLIAPNPLLQALCHEVKPDIPKSYLTGVIRELHHVLTQHKNGIGLAANQIGILYRIIIIKSNNNFRTFINPDIIATGTVMTVNQEGCLSYPGVFRKIKRFEEIEVSYCDENFQQYTEWFSELESIIVQHEIDHLNGKCIVGER